MPRITQDELHPTPTATNGRRYLFTPKHHGCGDRDAACWRLELTREQEFEVFVNADREAVCDDRGHHYGVSRVDGGGLLVLGTWGQEVAKFPFARDGEPWHGYPLYLVNEDGPKDCQGHQMRPSKAVLMKLEKSLLISDTERKRLMKGDPA